MDIDKLKQWMDIAQNMQGGDFWKNVFDQDFAKQFINDHSANFSTETGNNGSREKKVEPTFPLIEVFEGTDEVIVIIELPGIPKEQIELGLNGNVLSIKGIATLAINSNLKRTYSERFYGEFQRQIKLPDSVNPTDLKAKYWNGLLFVSYNRFSVKEEMIPID